MSRRKLSSFSTGIGNRLFSTCLIAGLLLVLSLQSVVNSQQNDNDLVFDEVERDSDAYLHSSQQQSVFPDEDSSLIRGSFRRIKRQFLDLFGLGGQQEHASPPSPIEHSTDVTTKSASALTSGDETGKEEEEDGDEAEGETDEEDKDVTESEHSGDMPSETPPTTVFPSPTEFDRHYFRVFLKILEPFLENYSNQKSTEFKLFAYNVTRGLNLIFGSLPDRIITTVVSIEKTTTTDLLKVVLNLDASDRHSKDYIENEIYEHLRQKRSLGDLKATHEGLIVKDIGTTPPNTCKPYEVPCDNSPTCYPLSVKCDGFTDCSDGSDELQCVKDEESTNTLSTSTTIASSPPTDVASSSTTTSTTTEVVIVAINTTDTSSPDSTSTSTSSDVSSSISPIRTADENTEAPVIDVDRKIGLDNRCRGDNTYRCKNNVTIICAPQRCDGQKDCPDGDDEEECPKACTPDEFLCDNDMCLSLSVLCDGRSDCADGTDERNCIQPKCTPDQLRCSEDGACIDGSKRCDGYRDCSNGEDEQDCACKLDEFRCGTGICIPQTQFCDGVRNCQDESDEKNCSIRCSPNEFSCDDGQCLHNEMRCNYVRDCRNGEDEIGCPPYIDTTTTSSTTIDITTSSTSTIETSSVSNATETTIGTSSSTISTVLPPCEDYEFQCADGVCVQKRFKCDGVYDCQDGSDEEHCPTSTTTSTLAPCAPGDIMCGDGTCVNISRRCDGHVDCSDYVDELNCRRCETEEFQCESGQCIPFNRRCDRRFDCPDGSDERECPSTTTELIYTRPPTCSRDQFTCRRRFQCIPLAARCNNEFDCLDYSDEDPNECRVTQPDYPQGELNLKTYPNDQTIKEEREGGDVVFQCRDEGPIRAPVEWIRAEQLPLPPGSRDVNGRLEIPNIQINHTGVYICKAYGYRSIRGSEVQVYLNVIPYPKPTEPPTKFCGVNEATCRNGQCIPKKLVCNGQYDCDDHSDEDRCGSQGCEPNEFRCNNRRCVQKTWRCDSENDCGDNSDEQNCDPSPPGSPCRYDEYHCKTGNQCIPKAFHCDAQMDCHDGSDEVGCSQVTIITPPPHMVNLDQGDTFTVTCRAYGVPTPEVIWRLNWGHIPAKCTMTSTNGFGTLVCPDVQEADQGAYSCEALNSRGSVFASPDAILIVKRPAPPSCPAGTFNDLANTTNDCINCFCFGATTECKSANLFIYQLPPPITLLKIVHTYFSPTRGTIEFNDKVVSPLQNYFFPLSNEEGFQILGIFEETDRSVEHGTLASPYFSLPEHFYGNQLKSYGGYIKFTIKFEARGTPLQTPLIILSGNGYKLYHKEPTFYSRQKKDISVRIFYGYWYKELQNKGDVPVYTPETLATREEIMMALANVDHILIQIQFVDDKQIATSISNVRVDSAGVVNTGQGQAAYVEECRCPIGYSGLSCETCSSGYNRRTDGPWLGQCYKEPQVCPLGTYGDPERAIPCKPCPCPSTSSPNQFTRSCYLDTDGQPTCRCPAGYAGRRCEQCSYGYVGNPLYPGDYCKSAICDPDGAVSSVPDPISGQCTCKDFTTGQYCNQCKPNTFFLSSGNVFGCISCFCMGTTNQCQSSNWYRNQIVSTFTRDSQDFKIAERRNLKASSADFVINPNEKEIVYSRFPTTKQGVHYWILPLKFLHDKITSYGGYLNYTVRYVPVPGGQLSRNIAPDVQILSGNKIELLYFSKETVQANVYQTMSVPLLEQYWQRPDGATANREHLLMALADLDAILVKATYTTNTQEVAIQYVSLDIAEERNTGQKRAYEVEECSCPAGHRGLSCQDCDVGYTRVDQGLYLGICELCSCNGHSTECHPETGVCLNCGNHTMGDKCERCIPGYKGEPEKGEACLPLDPTGCNCDPRGISAMGCVDNRCICKTNVAGSTCFRCRSGTFDLHESHPEGCISCYCSGVTDHCNSSNLFITQIPMQLIDQSHGFTLTDRDRLRVIKSDFILNVRQNQIGYDYTTERGQQLFWSLPPAFTGDRVTSYGGNLTWTQLYTAPSSAILNYDTDVVVYGNGISIHWTNDVPLTPNLSVTRTVPFIEGGWRRLISNGPQRATRNDIMLVLSSVEAILIKAVYASQTSLTYISDVSLDTAISESTGQARATHVESCRCPTGYKGFSCEACAKGFYTSSLYSAVRLECRQCPCNGREESCSLAQDYTIICNCLPGYTGRFCEILEHIQGGGSEKNTTTVSEPPIIDTTTGPTVGPPLIYIKITEPVIQIVAVGSTVNYKCSAESIYKRPIISLMWSKQDGELPRERAIVSGDGSLTLLSTDISDSGVYVCTAFDGYAVASQRVQLTVGDPVAPKVYLYPSTVIEVNEGDVFEVTSQVTGIPFPDIEWGRLGQQLTGSRSALRNVNKFRLESVTRADEGTYYCRAINYLGTDVKTFTVRVNGDIDTRFPKDVTKLVVHPTEFTGSNGDNVRFECSIISGPGVNVTWTRSGNRPLPPTSVVRNGVFVIFNATPADSGTYICQGLNEQGVGIGSSVSVLANILRSTPEYSEPPVLRIEPQYQTVSQGSNVIIRCVSPSDPDIPIEWSKSSEQLPNRAQVHGSELRISSVQILDRGVYLCKASNSAGPSQVSYNLEVERREIPAVEIYPKAMQTAVEGSSAVLQCRTVAGVPTPTVVWSRSGNESFTSHVEVLPNGVLRFRGLTLEDEGQYVCSATNEAGFIQAIAMIRVNSFPVITLNPANTASFNVGQRIHLECRATGKPSPNVVWSRSGLPSSRQYGSPVAANQVAVFDISSAQESDSGIYTCTAVNDAGSTEERIQLIINGGDDDGIQFRPEVRSDFASPSIRPDEEFVYPVGAVVTVRCESDVPLDAIHVVWKRPGNAPLPAQHEIRPGELIVYNIKRNDAGIYTCIGVDPQTDTKLFAKSANVRVVDPPQITLYPIRQVVRPGDNAYVRCSASGDEPIVLSWATQRGDPLPYSVQTDKGHLQFRGITVRDAGKYVCRAKNLGGEAEAVAEVIVNAYARPTRPVITAEDRSQFAIDGSNLDLKCTVESPTSDYRITWQRERTSDLPRNSKILGDTLRLYNLRAEDSDRYICHISSPFGTSNDYIDLQVIPRLHTVNFGENCLQDQFRCSDGQCIGKSLYCDGHIDCVDNSDEIDCHKYRRGASNVSIDIEPSQDDFKAGDTCILTCAVNGDSNANVTWSKVAGKIANNVIIDGGKLRIPELQIANSGVYKCTVISKYGVMSETYNLGIQLADGAHSMIAMDVKSVPYGKTADLNCTTNLEPPVNYSWIIHSNDPSLRKTVNSNIATLTNITAGHSGLHVCLVSNDKTSVEIPTALVVTNVIPLFNGSSYLKFQPITNALITFDIKIAFKPYADNGLILFDGYSQGKDFVSFGLRDGFAEFKFDAGSGSATIKSDSPLPLNMWHVVRLTRSKSLGTMEIGNVNYTGSSPGNFVGLDLNLPLYIGGAPDFGRIRNTTGLGFGFTGCISYVTVDSKVIDLKSDSIESYDVLPCDNCADNRCLNGGICQEFPNDAGYSCICPKGFVGVNCNQAGDTCYPGTCGKGRCIVTNDIVDCLCPYGKTGKSCSKDIKIKLPAFNRNSYSAYWLPFVKDSIKIAFTFRPAPDTSVKDGILLYASTDNSGESDFIVSAIINRHLVFKLNTYQGSVKLKSQRELSRGAYTSVVISIDESEVFVSVDDEIMKSKIYDSIDADVAYSVIKLRTPLYVGGYDIEKVKLPNNIGTEVGFYGCVTELHIMDTNINLTEKLVDAANVYDCYTLFGDLCSSGNPCRNYGTCSSTKGEYYCQCVDGFRGKHCQHEVDVCVLDQPCQHGGECSRSAKSYVCDCVDGYGGRNCDNKISTNISFDGKGYARLFPSLLTYDKTKETEELIGVLFVTTFNDGLLFWNGNNRTMSPEDDFLAINVENGYVTLTFSSDSKHKVTKATDHKVSDGALHRVSVKRREKDINLELDDETIEVILIDDDFMVDGDIYIGGIPYIFETTGSLYKDNFNGCIKSLYLNNELIDFSSNSQKIRNAEICSNSKGNMFDDAPYPATHNS